MGGREGEVREEYQRGLKQERGADVESAEGGDGSGGG